MAHKNPSAPYLHKRRQRWVVSHRVCNIILSKNKKHNAVPVNSHCEEHDQHNKLCKIKVHEGIKPSRKHGLFFDTTVLLTVLFSPPAF